MFSQRQTYIIIGSILLFSGCVLKDTTPSVPKKETSKKESKKTPTKKIIHKYKYCNKHTDIMNFAYSYITNEFQKGYFSQKDALGAKAQIYLIENNSPTIFAQNINKANSSYKKQYELALKNKCNLDKFKVSPLQRVKNSIEVLEKEEERKIKNENH